MPLPKRRDMCTVSHVPSITRSYLGPLARYVAAVCTLPTTPVLLLAHNLLLSNSAAFAHAPENASSVVQVDGCVEFGNLALIHDADAVVIDNRL
jgi:hypothetical protein